MTDPANLPFFRHMNKKTLAACLATLAMLQLQLLARIGETEAEVEARYGKPESTSRYDTIEPDHNAQNPPSAEDRERNLIAERNAFPEDFRKDGSRIDFVGEDAMVLAKSRLVFFNPGTSTWEDLRSSVIGRKPTDQDGDALKQLTITARKHLRQRFYIRNGINISVVYLGSRSVSESYHQEGAGFNIDSINDLIKKSFPDGVIDYDKNAPESFPAIRILSPDSKEIRGCATYDGTLTVSATPYFIFLKAMEEALVKNAELKQSQKIEGF